MFLGVIVGWIVFIEACPNISRCIREVRRKIYLALIVCRIQSRGGRGVAEEELVAISGHDVSARQSFTNHHLISSFYSSIRQDVTT